MTWSEKVRKSGKKLTGAVHSLLSVRIGQTGSPRQHLDRQPAVGSRMRVFLLPETAVGRTEIGRDKLPRSGSGLHHRGVSEAINQRTWTRPRTPAGARTRMPRQGRVCLRAWFTTTRTTPDRSEIGSATDAKSSRSSTKQTGKTSMNCATATSPTGSPIPSGWNPGAGINRMQ